ncbi:hypothetical protein [Bacillus sp. B1-b2]|uniref:hypothetical protein n=1 Tax=Bacillus sp. B1-b2 TaxID=2653201 RepID=UPI001261F73B|nr:hypothetical protein [Bacillus sp. B1-b2]KAB7672561.1 hypothetical protein F9279_02730 [Bacillus sp. B1-b2]
MELWIAKINTNKKHPIQELISQLIINEDNNSYNSYEYNGTIVVKTCNKNTKSVFLSHYNIKSKSERIPMFYDENYDAWFDKGDEERAPVGINQCGTFFFEAENNEGYVVNRTRDVFVTSKLLSEEEFEQMKDEIANILEDLAVSTSGPVNLLSQKQEQINRMIETHKKIEELKELLLDIDRNPHFELTQQNKLQNYSKVKRINIKTLMEKKLYPFKDKFMVVENVPSTEIIEHGMIRWSLEVLRQNFNRYLLKEQLKISEINNRIQDLINSQSLLGNQRDFSFEGKRISNSIEKDLNFLRKLLLQAEEMESSVENILSSVDDCLQFSILSVKAEELDITQLFTFSPLYSQVFQCINDLLDENNKKSIAFTYQSLQKTPFLYEIWGLLSIIHSLIYNCGFISTMNPFSKIKFYVENGMDLEGIKFSFERPVYRSPINVNQGNYIDGKYIYKQQKSILKLELCYEKVIKGAEKPYKPDYTFIFNDGQSEKTAFLDAKYKPIEDERIWNGIIKDVSFNKYYKTLDSKPIASFLMHPNPLKDSGVNNWNMITKQREASRHLFGSFHFRPNERSSFIEWINMLVHYHLMYDGVCFHCGTHQSTVCESTDGKRWRKYHTCQNNDCEAFWVKSSCFNRIDGPNKLNDAHSKISATLYKYTKHSNMNYHLETDVDWDVLCPVCDKSAKDLPRRYNYY